jgi:4-hydroxy-4-methyl-2-oxoglutarate aldolase
MDDSPADDSATTADALRALGSATLGESGARAMAARIRAAWPGALLAAPATPVSCTTGDNLAIHVAVATAPRGSALVVSVGNERELGYWGEVLTTGAEAHGIAGLVIDGGVRDVAALEAHGFPVFSAMIALRGATKLLPGTVGGDVTVGGVLVQRGDWVVGDADGVVIVPGAQLRDVLVAGETRAAKEQGYFEALRGGTTTVELLGLDASPIDVTSD